MICVGIEDLIDIKQEEKAIERGILPLLQRATLVQTFGQRNHVCLDEGSITIPPFAPPQKMQAHFIPPDIPRSIFVYFRGLFYDVNNDPEGGYYARYIFCRLVKLVSREVLLEMELSNSIVSYNK